MENVWRGIGGRSQLMLFGTHDVCVAGRASLLFTDYEKWLERSSRGRAHGHGIGAYLVHCTE